MTVTDSWPAVVGYHRERVLEWVAMAKKPAKSSPVKKTARSRSRKAGAARAAPPREMGVAELQRLKLLYDISETLSRSVTLEEVA